MTDLSEDPVVIVSAARTPMGGFQGDLAAVSATRLGSTSIAAALRRPGIDPQTVDEVIMGCVLPAGLGQAPARQAALGAGISEHSACLTINKMCGSGMKAVMLAHDQVRLNSSQTVVAGGFESMSNAPYLLPKVRAGLRMGHGSVIDHLFLDGLEDAYQTGKLMGCFAEKAADHFNVSRDQQDDFAIRSLTRAQKAAGEGILGREIEPVSIPTRQGTQQVNADEQPPKANLENIRQLKPAFDPSGTITAANASSISDGAAALVLMRQSKAEKLGLEPRAKILAHTTFAHAPEWFTTAPISAVSSLLNQLGLSAADIDLYEINEAFAIVTMAAIQELNLDPEKVNIHGGACALGHPIGASGARILVTLINALEAHQLSTGIASLCIGGGEATAIAIQRYEP